MEDALRAAALMEEYRAGEAPRDAVVEAYTLLLKGHLESEELTRVAQEGPLRSPEVMRGLLEHPATTTEHLVEAAWSAFRGENDLAPAERGKGIQEASLEVLRASGLEGAVVAFLLQYALESTKAELHASAASLTRGGREAVEIFISLVLDMSVRETNMTTILERARAAEQLATHQ